MLRRLLLFLLLSLVLTACNSQNQVLPEKMPDDFGFSLKYGVTLANELNTYDDTFTKDLIERGSVTTDMVLSNEELEVIYEKFRSADVLGLPEVRNSSSCQKPFSRYELSMTVDDEEYNLKWDSSCESKALNKWESTLNYINKEIIYPKEEYQSLPEATSGYQ
nr:hypothetical protein [Paenibacillus bovis]